MKAWYPTLSRPGLEGIGSALCAAGASMKPVNINQRDNCGKTTMVDRHSCFSHSTKVMWLPCCAWKPNSDVLLSGCMLNVQQVHCMKPCTQSDTQVLQ